MSIGSFKIQANNVYVCIRRDKREKKKNKSRGKRPKKRIRERKKRIVSKTQSDEINVDITFFIPLSIFSFFRSFILSFFSLALGFRLRSHRESRKINADVAFIETKKGDILKSM